MIADLWQDLRYGARMMIKQKGATAVAVLMLALCLGANTAKAQPIAFEAYGAYIFAPVRINSSQPLWFILDTGKRRTEINEKRARALGLKLKGAKLQIADATLENLKIEASSFGELEAEFGRRVDGIIGYDLFRRFVVEIDYAARTIGFFTPESYQYTGTEQPIPIRVRDELAFVQCLIEREGQDAVAGEFELDTGEGGALELNTPFVKGHQLLASAGRTLPLRGWGADENGYEALVGRLQGFRIGRFTLGNPIVYFPQTGKGDVGRADYAGLLGGRILQRFKLILDYTRERMILEPNAHLAEPFEWNMSGMFCEVQGADFDTYRVARILASSPAEEAGLRKGDVVLTINGQPPATLGLMEFEQMFRQEGRELRLNVRRNNKQTLELTLKTRRLI